MLWDLGAHVVDQGMSCVFTSSARDYRFACTSTHSSIHSTAAPRAYSSGPLRSSRDGHGLCSQPARPGSFSRRRRLALHPLLHLSLSSSPGLCRTRHSHRRSPRRAGRNLPFCTHRCRTTPFPRRRYARLVRKARYGSSRESTESGPNSQLPPGHVRIVRTRYAPLPLAWPLDDQRGRDAWQSPRVGRERYPDFARALCRLLRQRRRGYRCWGRRERAGSIGSQAGASG